METMITRTTIAISMITLVVSVTAAHAQSVVRPADLLLYGIMNDNSDLQRRQLNELRLQREAIERQNEILRQGQQRLLQQQQALQRQQQPRQFNDGWR